MRVISLRKYTTYNIHGKGVPEPLYPDELHDLLKQYANKKTYDNSKQIVKNGKHKANASHAINGKVSEIKETTIISILPALKKSFPNLNFRLSGHFIYGPSDFMGEHTNKDDATEVMYLTYATGKSKFSYRFSQDEPFIDTYDNIDGLTIRAFTASAREPYTFHKVDCESGYRVSIGLRYINIG